MKTLAQTSTMIILFVGLFISVQATTVIDLEWKTKSELNNDFFTIERSVDGKNWQVIATVDGNGSTSEEHSYIYSDENAPMGMVYYNLRQTDFDGKSVSTKVISIQNMEKPIVVEVIAFPNPTTSFITVQASQDIVVTAILSSKSVQVPVLIDTDSHVINVSHLQVGMYYIVCKTDEGQSYTIPFVKN